ATCAQKGMYHGASTHTPLGRRRGAPGSGVDPGAGHRPARCSRPPHVQGDEVNMGYFPAKSAIAQPTCKGRETNRRRMWTTSVSDGWSPEILHGVVSMMIATLLFFQGHFCLSFTLNRARITSSDAKIAWFNPTP